MSDIFDDDAEKVRRVIDDIGRQRRVLTAVRPMVSGEAARALALSITKLDEAALWAERALDGGP